MCPRVRGAWANLEKYATTLNPEQRRFLRFFISVMACFSTFLCPPAKKKPSWSLLSTMIFFCRIQRCCLFLKILPREMIREGPTVNPNPKPKTLNMAQAGDDAVRVFTRTGAASSEVPEGKEDVRSPETAPAPSGGVSQPLEGKTAGWCLAAEVPQVCPPIGRERVY